MNDSLGDRMKQNYEDRSRSYLVRRTPVIIRVDGRAFHTLTRKAEKPFDQGFVEVMSMSASLVASEMQGFKAGYVQSDEASFLLMDDASIETEAWFDYNQQKLVSISAALMTAFFNSNPSLADFFERTGQKRYPAIFDARAFNIPHSEVANYFLWRAKDWQRNSIQMFARAFYSQKQLHGLGRRAMLEKLEADGHHWNELPERLKNGTWIGPTWLNVNYHIRPDFTSVNGWLDGILHPTSEDDL